jgi:predicted RNA binding protein YcfA (HicA-like mRNA interferase family)
MAALKADGWREVRSSGSHRQFAHPTKPGVVTVPAHPGDLPKFIVQSIEKQAGIKLTK